MNFRRRGVRSTGDAYSSYHGKNHNTRITTKPKVHSGHGALMNTVCAGHVVSSETCSLVPMESLLNSKQDVDRESN